jgi:shikimate kinase
MLPPGCGAYSEGTVLSVITTGSGSALPRDSVVQSTANSLPRRRHPNNNPESQVLERGVSRATCRAQAGS